MKSNSNKPEFSERLRAAIEKHQQAIAEASSYRQLQDEANGELAAFSATGDLRDLKAISEILPRQQQAILVERRIALADEAGIAAEQDLAAEVTAAHRTILEALGRVRCGLVEKAARSMKEHFDNFQAARRQAFSSAAVREKDALEHRLRSMTINTDPPQMAQELLQIAPAILGQVTTLEKELGGIPSESELRAP